MAELNEHVAYLSQEIGPRPAGTEEEQRAALYISEQFSAEAGLTTAMEDFQCNPDSSLPRTLCSGVAVLVTLVATIVGALAVPAIVVSLICAALAAAEVFDKRCFRGFEPWCESERRRALPACEIADASESETQGDRGGELRQR